MNIHVINNFLISPLATFFFNNRYKGTCLPWGHYITLSWKDFSSPHLRSATKDKNVYKIFSTRSNSWLAFRYEHTRNGTIQIPVVFMNKRIQTAYSQISWIGDGIEIRWWDFVCLGHLLHEIGHLALHWNVLIKNITYNPVTTSEPIVWKAGDELEKEAWEFAVTLARLFCSNGLINDQQLNSLDQICHERKATIASNKELKSFRFFFSE